MKLLLKLLLLLCVLLVGIYATSPWWIPQVLARQLPQGLQLEEMKLAYPGFTGIQVDTLNIEGEFAEYGLTLTAADIHFSYKDWKTEIGSVVLDVNMKAEKGDTADSLTLDDLSLPVARLTGYPPVVSIDEFQVTIHHSIDFEPANLVADKPLILNFKTSNLTPRVKSGFHLSSSMSTDVAPEVNGWLEIEVSPTSRKADIRFPAIVNSPPWLTLSIEQEDRETRTTTQVQAVIDTDVDDQLWLDKIPEFGAGDQINKLSGKIEIQALFAGRERQVIEHLSMTSDQFQASSDDGSLLLDVELLAKRDGEKINVSLTEPAKLQYQDHNDGFKTLLESVLPGLQLHARPNSLTSAVIAANSSIVIQTGAEPLFGFNGNFNLDVSSPGSRIELQATDFQFDSGDISDFDPNTVKGLILLDWEEKNPLGFSANELDLKVDEMSISAEIIPAEGKIVSHGSGSFTTAKITSPTTSTTRVDVTWRQFDLLKLTGEIEANTTGFATDIDGESWSGFDFNLVIALLGNSNARGSGTIRFDPGPYLPMTFEGNTQAEKWDITFPPSSIELTQLSSILRVAHFDLPESVRLSDGTIDLQGRALSDNGISAKMIIKGHELNASVLESSARNAGFSLDVSYGTTISATGPVSIESVNLAGGIDVGGLKTELDLIGTDTIKLKNLYAEVFDGVVNLDSLYVSESRIEDTTIELSHINLARLLAYANIDGLEGTGFLDFKLPAGSDQTGVYIENGSFSSSGSGHLSYKKEDVASSNIGLQALENFQYQVLSGTVDYQSDGTYRIGIHLEGNNPDLYEGHPIVFNLNITGSLPELFEALFITGSFEESILKQIGIN